MEARLLADKRVVSLVGKVVMLVLEWPLADKRVGLAAEKVATSAAEKELVERPQASSIQKCHLLTIQYLKFKRGTLIYERCKNKSIKNCIPQLRDRVNSLKIIMGLTNPSK